jgi:hypothetical protein
VGLREALERQMNPPAPEKFRPPTVFGRIRQKIPEEIENQKVPAVF